MDNRKHIVLDSVEAYNDLHGFETLHPLVGVVDMKDGRPLTVSCTIDYGIYALFLKQSVCCSILYGRRPYDYQKGTVVSFAPGQTIGFDPMPDDGTPAECLGLVFHPDLIRGTELARNIHRFSFFNYLSNEALHLSERERQVFEDCLGNIRQELEHAIDSHSRQLIISNIELLLNYCMRFYDRQFITRDMVNTEILSDFERMLNEYFAAGKALEHGLPSVRYFADKACLSANYFGDLIKRKTGRTAQEYIQFKLVEMAKDRLAGTSDTVTLIAESLGFQYPQHFARLFKRNTGLTPNQYREKLAAR